MKKLFIIVLVVLVGLFEAGVNGFAQKADEPRLEEGIT